MSVSQEASPVVEPVAVAPASRRLIAAQVLQTHSWPGDARELRHVLPRALIEQVPVTPIVAVTCDELSVPTGSGRYAMGVANERMWPSVSASARGRFVTSWRGYVPPE